MSDVLSPGDIVEGKYRVVRLLASGGMGLVYEGRNIRLDRRVAIKVMHGAIAQDPELVARFDREAQAAAKIRSKHITDVLDLGDLPNGDRFMVMELLEGESLAARLSTEARLPAEEVATIGIQLLEGLSKVHEAGILHRDLKPANIFLLTADDGVFLKILDLGICKFMKKGVGGELETAIGNLMGTLSYMAPEYLEHGGRKLDPRADLYSVGVILYRCLSGELPFRAKNPVQLLTLLRSGKPAPIREITPELDVAFAEVVDKAIEWDPAARYQTAKAFQLALNHWVETHSRVQDLLSDFLEVPRRSVRPPSSSVRPPAMASAEPEPAHEAVSQTRRSTKSPAASAKPPAAPAASAKPTRRPSKQLTAFRPAAPTVPAHDESELAVDVEFDKDDLAEVDTEPFHARKSVPTARMKGAPLPSLAVDDDVTVERKPAGPTAPPRGRQTRRK